MKGSPRGGHISFGHSVVAWDSVKFLLSTRKMMMMIGCVCFHDFSPSHFLLFFWVDTHSFLLFFGGVNHVEKLGGYSHGLTTHLLQQNGPFSSPLSSQSRIYMIAEPVKEPAFSLFRPFWFLELFLSSVTCRQSYIWISHHKGWIHVPFNAIRQYQTKYSLIEVNWCVRTYYSGFY